MSRIIREAQPLDMADIMTVMDAAKKTMVSTNRLMRQSGNLHQWGEGYPSEAVIAADMEKDPNIRIDTHRDNKIMQHNILKHGFTYCGIIYLLSGDALDQRSLATRGTQERLAYQKIVNR